MDDDGINCQKIGRNPIKTIAFVEGSKPKTRTLQQRQNSFTVTLPKSWVRRNLIDPFKEAKEVLDETQVVLHQWRDPSTAEFKGFFIEVKQANKRRKG